MGIFRIQTSSLFEVTSFRVSGLSKYDRGSEADRRYVLAAISNDPDAFYSTGRGRRGIAYVMSCLA